MINMNILAKKSTMIVFASSLLFVGVFLFGIQTTHAQDEGSFDAGYIAGGSFDGGYAAGGSFDGGYAGNGSFDGGYAGNGSFDGGYVGNGSFDAGNPGSGSFDAGVLGNGSFDAGYLGSGSFDAGYLGNGSFDGGYIGNGTFDPGYVASGTFDPGYVADPTYTYVDYGNGCDYSCGTDYVDYGGGWAGYSTASYGYVAPMAITAPKYVGTSVAQQPVRTQTVTQPIVIQQQQQQQTQPINIVNNNVNTNTNTNTNSAPVTPIYQTPIAYNVQYVSPQPYYYNNYGYNYGYNYPNYYSNVSCSISASPNSISAGQYVYLTWSSSGNVSYATLSGVGTVGPNGSWSVRPYGSTNYVLTVYGTNGQTATCNTYVTIGNVAPYVTLSQIPYTGFDFGPMGNAIYWASLLAFALSAAYLVIYFRGGSAALAGSMFGGRTTRATVIQAPAVALAQAAPAPVAAPKKVEEFALPTFNQRQTIDSMAITKGTGIPRIVITRA
jgi:hypothetical protein